MKSSNKTVEFLIVAYFPKASNVEPEEQPLLSSSCVTWNNGVTIGSAVVFALHVKAI
jgi:hypothetical protein